MMNFQRLGWVVAAAILGVFAASGFQGSFQKVASVDLENLVETSDLGKTNLAAFNATQTTYNQLLGFVDENRVLTIDEAKKLRELWLKETPGAVDKASLESLKASIVAETKQNDLLSGKPNLTPEERIQLQAFSSRSAQTEQLEAQWYQEFGQALQQSSLQRKADTLTKAKAAAQSVAKAQGYTLMFDASVAPYAVNDLTPDALKAMNAQK